MLPMIQRDTVDDTIDMLREAGFEVEAMIPDQYVGAVSVMKAIKVREVRTEVSAPRAVCAFDRLGDAGMRVPHGGESPRDDDVRDVFVSYATEDQEIAEDIRAYLEGEAIPCWIAPRDIQPGDNFPAKIVHAIDRSRVFVLVLSAAANRSSYAAREVARAADRGIPIVPFRAEDVPPSDSLALYLSNVHWLDALSGPRAQHLERLGQTIKGMNDDPDTSVIEILRRDEGPAALTDLLADLAPNHTFPTHDRYPQTRLDYLFASPSALPLVERNTRKIHREEPAALASDHFPATVTLRVP